MSSYFYLADEYEKKLYSLGKLNHAKYILPYMAYLLRERDVCLFCDAINLDAANRYSDEVSWTDVNWELDDIPVEVKSQLDEITMSRFEFEQIFLQICGRTVNNLDKYISTKFTDNLTFREKQKEWFRLFEE